MKKIQLTVGSETRKIISQKKWLVLDNLNSILFTNASRVHLEAMLNTYPAKKSANWKLVHEDQIDFKVIN